MLALSLGLWAAQPLCQCIVSYAGLLIPAPTPPTQHPSCLLIHGKADELIPYQASEEAKKRLTKYHVPAQLELISHLGHGIDPQGITSEAFFRKSTCKNKSFLYKQNKYWGEIND